MTEAKDGTRTYGPQSWRPAEGGKKGKPCDASVLGVFVVGDHRGETLRVCVDRDCPTHKGRERQRNARSRVSSSAALKAAETRRKNEEAQKAREELRWKTAAPLILEDLAGRLKKAKINANSPALARIVRDANHVPWNASPKLAALIPVGKSAEDILRRLAWNELVRDAYEYRAHERFPKAARAYGVDVKKHLAAAAAAVQTSAAKKSADA